MIKTYINTNAQVADFTLQNSYAVTGESSVFLGTREGTTIQVYTSTDSGVSWDAPTAIDAANGDKAVNFELTPGVTHVNFTSNEDSKVLVFRLEHGLSRRSVTPVGIDGEQIFESEAIALAARAETISNVQLASRPLIQIPQSPSRVAGTWISTGSNGANLAGKSVIIYVNGRAIHSDDYATSPSDNGDINFSFDLFDASSIHILAWE